MVAERPAAARFALRLWWASFPAAASRVLLSSDWRRGRDVVNERDAGGSWRARAWREG